MPTLNSLNYKVIERMEEKMGRAIQILVIDDHQVVREGLRRLLEQEGDMKVIGQASNSEEALSQVEKLSPHIVLMDIKMPGVDGIELTRQVKLKKPSCKVIMLTLYDEYLTQAMEAGATGYLLKDIKREDLAQAIRQVRRGEIVISESITFKTRNAYAERLAGRTEEGPDALFEEVQLAIPPPVDANQLMRFASQVEEMLQSRVLRVVGSWQEGTIMTILLGRAMVLEDILNRLREIPEIGETGEKPLKGEPSPGLLKKATAIPRLKNRPRKTIFVTLGKS